MVHDVGDRDAVRTSYLPTLCSISSFFDTLSKYPSHIFLKRARISFSTSSSFSVSFPRRGKAWAFSCVVGARDPGSTPSEIWDFVEVTGAIPRYGLAYVFKNVESRGKDDNDGSLESYIPEKADYSLVRN